MRKTTIAACLTLALASPLSAGVKMTTVTSATGANAEMQNQTAEGWVSGSKMKVVMTESGNPLLEKGSWLLTQDGGRTMYLVNPKEKTYARFDLEAMLSTATTALKAMGPMAKMTFSEPQVEKLAEEAGPEMLGLATTHTKFRTTYSLNMQVLMMKMNNKTETVEEVWSTTGLEDELGMRAWLRKGVRTGDPGFDRVIEAEMSKITGLPLKRVATTTTTDDKGRKTTTTVTTEVTALERGVDIPDSTFAIPAGFEEVELMPAGLPGGN
jgi:hypothetical protein